MSESKEILLLTGEQIEVIACDDGPHLVVAGAGTGKTRVLTQRIVHLIENGLAQPEEIMAVTFTNKAAREMRERLELQLDAIVEKIWVGSFHGLSLEIIKRHARDIGFKNEKIGILDEAGQTDLMIEVLQGLTSPSTFVPRKVAQILHETILTWKELGLNPDQIYPETLDTPLKRKALEVYPLYQSALLERNVCDFADLILHVVSLMRRDNRIRDYWRSRLKYVLVDEMQDVNSVQFEWLFHLSGREANIFCVGDARQAIYEWRNAKPDIMLHLGRHFDGVETHTITQNFRSTRQIVSCANAVVKNLRDFEGADLISEIDGPDPLIAVFDTQEQEVDFVIETIEKRVSNGQSLEEIAILTRSQFDLILFQKKLEEKKIPHHLVGGGRFKDNQYVLDILSYLRLANNPYDSLAFMRASNSPERHIRRQLLRQIDQIAVKEGCEIVRVLNSMSRFNQTYGLSMTPIEIGAMLHIADIIGEASVALASGQGGIGRAIQKVIDSTAYMAWAEFMDQTGQVKQVVSELVRIATHTTLPPTEFLSRIISGDIGDSQSSEGIALSTIHSAKGLEYELVFTPFVVEGKLPHYRALLDSEDPAEERRLAHVAWTRPKRELVITASWQTDLRPTVPSRYLRDIGFDIDDITLHVV